MVGMFLEVTYLFLIPINVNYVSMFNNALGSINMQHIILRLPQVIHRTGLSRSSIYLRMTNGEFPESVSLGGRAVGWLESEVDEWIVTKIEEGRINDHG